MTGVTATQMRAVLAFAERTLHVGDHRAVVPLLAGLAELVGADSATLHETDVRVPRQVSVGWPVQRLTVELAELMRPLLLTHPFVPLYTRLRPGAGVPRTPFRISDLLSQRQWRATPLAREVMPDARDQLGVMLGTRRGAVSNIVLTRHRGTFTDRQRDVLGLAAGHLAAATARVVPRGVGLQVAPDPRWVPLAGDRPAGPTGPAGSTGSIGPTGSSGSSGPAALSAREREVLRLVADGCTDAQVATRLGLSPRTVAKHLQRIYGRLGVANRAAATAWLLSEPPAPA